MVATVDFFTPIVDDAATWGAIAAANSASDVYAMGGKPLFALNVAAWPRDVLPLDLLGDVLAGAGAVAERGGWMVIGGHTIDGPEPMYGMSVVGEVHPDRILTNDAANPGDILVLTKPLGTGVIATALKRMPASAVAVGGTLHAPYLAAVEAMTTLNDRASVVAVAAGLRAATDITGFGLVGHLHKMALGSGACISIDVASLPIITGVRDLLADGVVPGGTGRNAEFVNPFVRNRPLWEAEANLLVDPQTSGGLVLCVPPDRLPDVLAELAATNVSAWIIGEVQPATESNPAGTITLT
jgi:selenide, water dikinase